MQIYSKYGLDYVNGCKNTFLHGEFDRDIYIEQPKEFKDKEKARICLQTKDSYLWAKAGSMNIEW